MLLATALALVLQQPVTPPPPTLPPTAPSVAARVALLPTTAAIQVGDTVRLRAVAYDSTGAELSLGSVRWFTSGGRFEGAVDSTGLVTGGSPGTLNVTGFVRAASDPKGSIAQARVTVLPTPAASVVVSPDISRLYVGQSLSLRAAPYSATGDRRYDTALWSSDRPAVLAVSAEGRLTAKAAGRAIITAKAGKATTSMVVTVALNPVASIELQGPASPVRTGDVVVLRFVARNAAGKAVDDVRPEWAVIGGGARVNGAGEFVAEEAGRYGVLASFAGRAAEVQVIAVPRDVVRPVRVVGRVPIKGTAAEFWLHPSGRYGYLTTLGDRVYAIDVSDPGKPFITDSVVVDARVINDLMTTEDGKYGVLTREGASTRKNGIVILSFEDPAHPKPIAEFTETVTGGVHSTYIYQGYVYLTDDATGSMRVIDIRDPYHPQQVARWETDRTPAGRMLHDIAVQDGLAYLSYWNDGLVILDVGNGIKRGRPENPTLVSQFKYDLEALYRDVEAIGGPGFIRGTHTAWRQGRYVFVGDEVFSATPASTGGSVAGLGRAYGRLHVVDVSDISRPREVAWYEPKDGGVHNVWVAGDTLYLGDYQGGLRVIDISGQLEGDLLLQGREIAHVATGDAKGSTPNAVNAWGAIYRDGYVYVPDMESGLWIVKVEAQSALVP